MYNFKWNKSNEAFINFSRRKKPFEISFAILICLDFKLLENRIIDWIFEIVNARDLSVYLLVLNLNSCGDASIKIWKYDS